MNLESIESTLTTWGYTYQEMIDNVASSVQSFTGGLIPASDIVNSEWVSLNTGMRLEFYEGTQEIRDIVRLTNQKGALVVAQAVVDGMDLKMKLLGVLVCPALAGVFIANELFDVTWNQNTGEVTIHLESWVKKAAQESKQAVIDAIHAAQGPLEAVDSLIKWVALGIGGFVVLKIMGLLK